MAVILSISEVGTPDLGAVTVVVVADLGAVTDLAQVVVETDLAQAAAEIGPVREQDQARDRNQAQVVVVKDQAQDRDRVQGLDLALDKDLVRVTRVPLVARARVEGLHRETVNVVHPAVPVNHAQEVHRAEVVVDVAAPVVVVVDAVVAVAEVVVADVDVDLKWQLKTPKQPHRTIE